MIDLNPIKARLAAVPPAPWQEFCESGDWWIAAKDVDGMPRDGGDICNSNSEDMTQEVVDFIVAAPSDIGVLLAEVERLRGILVAMFQGGESLPSSVFRELDDWIAAEEARRA